MKILFLGETYRADAITWMNGLKEFGGFEIITWELKTPSNGFKNRCLRMWEYVLCFHRVRKLIKIHKPDMIIAERTTSYGFLAALSGVKPMAVAQQGITDLWPGNSILLPLKKAIQHYAFKKAALIHAWGPAMTVSMNAAHVDMTKVLVLPKGIDLKTFTKGNIGDDGKIHAVVTRSLMPEYRHDIILKAFDILNQKGIDFILTIVGGGTQLDKLEALAKTLRINSKVNFTGRIANTQLPGILQQSNFYISMPTTEGVSSSLFEAMATHCYPIVTDIPGNKSWIRHRQNGQLVAVDDFMNLADEIVWAHENAAYRNQAILNNRKFVEENADYNANMKNIAARYHELIKQANYR
jgi:glycosyltransferase involved in cell wall biosynthesis